MTNNATNTPGTGADRSLNERKDLIAFNMVMELWDDPRIGPHSHLANIISLAVGTVIADAETLADALNAAGEVTEALLLVLNGIDGLQELYLMDSQSASVAVYFGWNEEEEEAHRVGEGFREAMERIGVTAEEIALLFEDTQAEDIERQLDGDLDFIDEEIYAIYKYLRTKNKANKADGDAEAPPVNDDTITLDFLRRDVPTLTSLLELRADGKNADIGRILKDMMREASVSDTVIAHKLGVGIIYFDALLDGHAVFTEAQLGLIYGYLLGRMA